MKFQILETSEPINIKDTLFSGQVFNFIETDKDEYTGVVYDFVISFKQENDIVKYKLLKCDEEILNNLTNLVINDTEYNFESQNASYYHQLAHRLNESLFTIDDDSEFVNKLISLLDKATEQAIRRFLTLDIDYRNFIPDKLYLKHKGLRLVRNAIVPTLFSFICSQNNNIKRITSMTQFLYSKGKFACKYKDIDLFFFPNLRKLTDIESELKNNKFGYRSRYVIKTATQLLEDNYNKWMNEDRSILFNFEDTKENITNYSNKYDKDCTRRLLTDLTGIGPKVADCILLMGFGFYEVVPIDTHIYKYAVETFNIKKKSLSKKDYEDVQKAFIDKFGKFAGIVQLYIFKSYI